MTAGSLAVAAFLLAHGGIHAGFLSPRPPATAGGPAWPFVLDQSWILRPLGLGGDVARLLGIALVATTFGGLALAALAALGIVPVGPWAPAIAVGAVASLALLALFFHPWLLLGVAIDALLLWAVFVLGWAPDGLAG
jgi:hypothetical protein